MLDQYQVDYTINTLISTLGLSSDTPIYYGDFQKDNGIYILCHSDINKYNENFGRKITGMPPNFGSLEDGTLVLYDHLNLNVGVPIIHYKDGEVAVAYDQKENRIIIGFDLIATSFYFLALMEEETVDKRDEHNRFCAGYGQLSSRFSAQPVVNGLQQILFKSILYLNDKMHMPVIQKWYWPSYKDFAVCLTHDIDFIKPGILYRLLLPFKNLLSFDSKRTILALKRYINPLYGKRDNPWDYRDILELEQKLGFRSTFFFTAGGRGKHDYPYDLDKEKKNLAELKRSGFEIGLHGSYSSSTDINALASEKRKLEEAGGKLSGIRQHYLRFDKDTFLKQENAGFDYDSTLYYADAIGFRGGLAHPFFPYNQSTKEKMNIMEIPPTVMDKTLLDYNKMEVDKAHNEIEKLIKTVEKHNGLLTLLWHNEMFDDVGFPGYRALYERILTDLKQRDAWIVRAEDIYTWWTGRQNIICEETEITDKAIVWRYKSASKVKDTAFRIHNIGNSKCTIKCVGNVETREEEGLLHFNIDKLKSGEKLLIEVKK
jgi:peptidoglycan/xylan/chitin deacetylase (PgdA/CDA1 family)